MAAPSSAVQRPAALWGMAPRGIPVHGDLIRSFFVELAKKIYPQRPATDPFPILTTWSWKYPYSLTCYEINPITADLVTEPIMVMKSTFGRIEAIVVKYFTQPNSCYNKITVYVLRDYFKEAYRHDPNHFTDFNVTKSLAPSDAAFLKTYF